MFRTTALVEKVKDNKVYLIIKRDKMCDCCGNIFCKTNSHIIVIDNNFGLKENDKVEIGISTKSLILVPIILFFIPSILFIFVLYLNKEKEIILSLCKSIFILFFYFLLLKLLILRRWERKKIYTILRKI